MAPAQPPASLREALDNDLHARRMQKKDLAAKLDMTYEGLRRWEIADRVPSGRIGDLAAALGDSAESVAYARRIRQEEFSGDTEPGSLYEPGKEHTGLRQMRGSPDMLTVEPVTAYQPSLPGLPAASSALEAEVWKALPPHLLVNARQHVQVGRSVREADYLSGRVALELKSGEVTRQRVETGLLQLVVLRELAPPADRRYLLVFVTPDPQKAWKAQRDLFVESHLLGVELHAVATPQEVADLIVEHERPPA